MADRLRVLLVEPYLGGSHRSWAEGYARTSAHDVDIVSLPAVHWRWRMQGAHLALGPAVDAAVAVGGPFDVVLASSMTNVPALLGHARRSLGTTPVVLYVHENQLTFPLPPGVERDLTYAMLNWTSMAASDRVVFNSRYHRDAWFEALPGFLARLPDHRARRLVDEVAGLSTVLPVGADLAALDRVPRITSGRPLLLWNHRWEWDKGPDVLARALERLVAIGVDLDVALAGERPAERPPELASLADLLGTRLVHEGHASPAEYRALLRRSDVVVSTARHEFFGVALTEAVYAGACPVVPDRLVYPERVPDELHDRCLYRSDDELVDRLRRLSTHRHEAAAIADELHPVMAALDWSSVAPAYDDLLAEAAGGRVAQGRPPR